MFASGILVRLTRRASQEAAHAGRLILGRLGRGPRALPDYLILGAQKAGTTSLHHYLLQHPDIAPSLKKEVHYFDLNFSKGETWYRAFFPLESERRAHERATGHRLMTGEATPYYLFHPLAPARARGTVPDARLIVLLRDPADRAYSHYRHEVSRGRERLSFREAITREAERLAGEWDALLRGRAELAPHHRRHAYVARGMYAVQLRRWLEHYPADRLLVLRSESFFASPQEHLDRVWRFLGLRPHTIDRFPVHNQGRDIGGLSHDDRALLREIFHEPNRELALLTGIDFDRSAAPESSGAV